MHVSERYRRNAEAWNEANSFEDSDASYLPLQHSQYQMEINYRVQATPWLSVMPNIQYIKNPDGVQEVDSAWVLGLQVQTRF